MCGDCDWAITEAVIQGEPAFRVEKKDANGNVCSCSSCFAPENLLVLTRQYLPPGATTTVERAEAWCCVCHHVIEDSHRRISRPESSDGHTRSTTPAPGFG